MFHRAYVVTCGQSVLALEKGTGELFLTREDADEEQRPSRWQLTGRR